jgi:hypothetical protein
LGGVIVNSTTAKHARVSSDGAVHYRQRAAIENPTTKKLGNVFRYETIF